MSTKPRKVSTGFGAATPTAFKTAKAAMTDVAPVTETEKVAEIDCTQIIGEVEAYVGPTQVEEETPSVAKQTVVETAGAPPPRPRFSYTSQSATPPPGATPPAAAASDALRDVLATAPVRRALSDASKHATAGDTAPPEPIDLTQDEDTEVEPPAPVPYESAPTKVDPVDADPMEDDPIEDDDGDAFAATQVEAPFAATPPDPTDEDDPIADAAAPPDAAQVDAILDEGRLRTQDPAAAAEPASEKPASLVEAILDEGRLRTQDPPAAEPNEPASDEPALDASRAATTGGSQPELTEEVLVPATPEEPASDTCAATTGGTQPELAKAPPVAQPEPAGEAAEAPAASPGGATALYDDSQPRLPAAAAAPVPSPAGATVPRRRSGGTATVLYDDSQTQPPEPAAAPALVSPAAPAQDKSSRPPAAPAQGKSPATATVLYDDTPSQPAPAPEDWDADDDAKAAAAPASQLPFAEPSQGGTSQPASQLDFASQPSQPSQGRPRRSESDRYAAICLDEDDDDAWPPPDEGAARDARTEGPARLINVPPGDIDVDALADDLARRGSDATSVQDCRARIAARLRDRFPCCSVAIGGRAASSQPQSHPSVSSVGSGSPTSIARVKQSTTKASPVWVVGLARPGPGTQHFFDCTLLVSHGSSPLMIALTCLGAECAAAAKILSAAAQIDEAAVYCPFERYWGPLQPPPSPLTQPSTSGFPGRRSAEGSPTQLSPPPAASPAFKLPTDDAAAPGLPRLPAAASQPREGSWLVGRGAAAPAAPPAPPAASDDDDDDDSPDASEDEVEGRKSSPWQGRRVPRRSSPAFALPRDSGGGRRLRRNLGAPPAPPPARDDDDEYEFDDGADAAAAAPPAKRRSPRSHHAARPSPAKRTARKPAAPKRRAAESSSESDADSPPKPPKPSRRAPLDGFESEPEAPKAKTRGATKAPPRKKRRSRPAAADDDADAARPALEKCRKSLQDAARGVQAAQAVYAKELDGYRDRLVDAAERLADVSRRSLTDQSARGDLHAIISELCKASGPAAPTVPSVPKALPARRARRARSPSSSSSDDDAAPALAPRKRPRARRAAPAASSSDKAPVPCSQADLPAEQQKKNQTALWHKLRSEGWTWRKASGLEENFWYLRPGAKGRVTELERNVDYFGVEDLWVHADAHALWPMSEYPDWPAPKKKKKQAAPASRERAVPGVPDTQDLNSQDVRAELLADDWELVLPPLAMQQLRPEVTELWKRPGVSGRNLVLGYNCFATLHDAGRNADYVIPMKIVCSEAAKWGWTDLLDDTLDDDAARFEYAKRKFEQENAVRASAKRARRGGGGE